MGQFNYLKLVWAILYLLLAGFSCYFTAESLLLTWPLITPFFSWVMAIALFIIASLGGAMICRSFSRNVYIRRRGLVLSGGVLIMLFVWLICCMPTNTHTLLFYNNINAVAQEDIDNTLLHLRQLYNKEDINKADVDAACDELDAKINLMSSGLYKEILNPENPGFGTESQKRLDAINRELDASIAPLSFKTGVLTKDQRSGICQNLNDEIEYAKQQKKLKIERQINAKVPMLDQIKAQAGENINSIEEWEKDWKDGVIDIKKPESLIGENGLDKRLQRGYGTIKSFKEFIVFSSPEDEERYCADVPTTKVKHVISVIDLWKEFLSGNLPNTGTMIFMIIISVLIDLSAFVFFYLLTSKNS